MKPASLAGNAVQNDETAAVAAKASTDLRSIYAVFM